MPKHKGEDDYEKILKKFKKLDKKVQRFRDRSRHSSSEKCSESQEQEHVIVTDQTAEVQANAAQMFDGPQISSHVTHGENYASLSTPKVVPVFFEIDTHMQESSCVNQASSLDNAILEILGEDPTIFNTFGPEVHTELAKRLKHIAAHGLSEKVRKELINKYLFPSNCQCINAPVLNLEMKAAAPETVVNRDKSIECRQKKIGIALSCLSQAIHKLILNNNSDSDLIKLLMDTARILCDAQHSDSVLRRNLILSSLTKNMKEQLQNTNIGLSLFGENLTEAIKAAEAIDESGAHLKASTIRQIKSRKSSIESVSHSSYDLQRNSYDAWRNRSRPSRRRRSQSLRSYWMW